MALRFLGLKDATEETRFFTETRDGLPVPRRTGRKTLYVLSDGLNDSPDYIRTAVGVPALYSQAGGMYVVSVTPRDLGRVVSPINGQASTLWEVDIDMDSEEQEGGQDPGGTQSDPTLLTPQIRWDSEEITEELRKDAITGDPIRTKANEKISVERQVQISVLEIQRYEPWPFSPSINLDYANHVNEHTFYGADPERVLMAPAVASREVVNGRFFAYVTYRFKFHGSSDPKPWQLKALHYGTMYRKNPGDKPIQHQDALGNPVRCFLKNADGTKLPDNAPPEYLDFNQYRKANFADLRLGGGGLPGG